MLHVLILTEQCQRRLYLSVEADIMRTADRAAVPAASVHAVKSTGALRMPTGYPGRETDYDLGHGHSLTWPGGGLLTERHTYGPRGGWHGFDIALAGMLASGGPGDETRLALTFPVQCPLCGVAGRITGGRWIPENQPGT